MGGFNLQDLMSKAKAQYESLRIAIAAASGVLGRAIKLKLVPGATVAPQEKKNGVQRFAPGPGGRGRAEQDLIVRRMQEKFGAEIRTVIDYRDKPGKERKEFSNWEIW